MGSNFGFTNKSMATVIFKLLYVFIFVCNREVFGIEDYCSVNQYVSEGNFMQFTKEPSTAEFAIIGKFKGLHCCAKGYRSIEWYKDGKPYPWHGTVSQLIIYPESANQTVYTQSVIADDAGNYTCLLRNDSVVHAHTIQLRVFDKVPDDPKITYVSDSAEVAVGQPIRLFCEAFVGLVELPDAYNEAVWSKAGENETVQNEPRIRQEKISREEGQTFGTYLIIDQITKDDFGEYICTISKPGKTIEVSTFINELTYVEYINPNPIPIKKMFIWCAIAIVLVITVLILNFQFGLLLRVHVKDRFGKLQENDDKINDVLIVYSQKDSELALGVLLPSLESKYNYKCASRQLLDDKNLWYTNLSESASKSRRLIAVMSPACLNDKWDPASLLHALKQLHDLDPEFCCILLKPISNSGNQIKNAQGETLTSVVRNINIIKWERSKDEQFWLALRLRLPPKRNGDIKLENVKIMDDNNK